MIKKNIFLNITVLCAWIIFLLPIIAEGETWREILQEGLDDRQFRRVEELIETGYFSRDSFHSFLDRLSREPPGDDAVERALQGGFSANVRRELHGIKRVFADPTIGAEALKKHYREHGPVRGTLWIVLSPVTIPVRSWGEIVSGEPGLGEYPLKILIGAASVILWGVLILSKRSKPTKYNYKAALSRFTIAISIIIFIVYSIIDGVVSGLTFVLYAVLFLGIQYLIIRWILYYIIFLMYRYVILWIYRGLKG